MRGFLLLEADIFRIDQKIEQFRIETKSDILQLDNKIDKMRN